ncbi:hypothetical protein V2J09_004532 [Rumex salicifolius]
MPSSHLLLLLLFFAAASTSVIAAAAALANPADALAVNYYDKTCPVFNTVMNQVVTAKQTSTPTTAAAVLRLFFHDCMVSGCDASTLVASNAFNKAERDAEINLSLPGDGFDVVTQAKTALEMQCPGVVSCTDILAVAARNLVRMVGGPYFDIRLGRKDGLVSLASRVRGNIAFPNMTITQLIDQFQSKGLSPQEMVALVGAHTIGFSHCTEFSNRLYKFSPTSEADPKLYPKYAKGLQQLCSNYKKDPSMAAFNDVMTPGKFDNMYYVNLQRGLGLLASDQALIDDERTKPFVERYAANQTAFFEDFASAMVKVSLFEIKTGNDGEVRLRCDQFNNIKVNKITG